MSISENIAAIRREIHLAAAKTGRTGADITLVGASKMNDAAACREAIAAGIDVLGENRVQEMTQKLAENAYDGVPLHFIGHLQRNKVKQVVGKAALIQSVSSTALLDEIEKTAEKLGEEAQSGFAPGALNEAACYAKTLPHVRVLGLMTIPPVETEPHGNMPLFTRMKALYVDINKNIYDNKLKYLSMGMSGDYAEAIEAGSNMVRVGTAVFGARNYSK